MITQVHNLIKNSDQLTESLNQESPKWLTDFRRQNLERFFKKGFPSIKDEEWKYTNIAPIVERSYAIANEGQLHESRHFQQYCKEDEIKIVFINGLYAPSLSSQTHLPTGVRITTLKETIRNNGTDLKPFFTRYEAKTEDAFVAINHAFVNDGTVITIDHNVLCDQLLHIVHVISQPEDEIIVLPRTLILVGRSSEATMLESHVAFSDEITYLSNTLTDIFLNENATLHYTKAQKESLKGYHIGNTRVWQEKDSNFDGFSFMTGGSITRNNLDVILNGEGSNTQLNGLYCTDHTQHIDNHTYVDHRVPYCKSNQLYKGILNGSSRAVFNGKIFVRPIAQKTNSYQLNKNLLLGKDCRIDTKPQLEIFADDVRCTHGATIGQLNEDEIFYLCSRAVSRRMAVKMLARGFVNDVLAHIQSQSVINKTNILLEPTFEAF